MTVDFSLLLVSIRDVIQRKLAALFSMRSFSSYSFVFKEKTDWTGGSFRWASGGLLLSHFSILNIHFGDWWFRLQLIVEFGGWKSDRPTLFFRPKTIPKFPTIEFTLFFISLFIFLFSFEIGNKILITLFQILLNFQLSDFFLFLASNYSENESMLSFQYYVNGKGRTWKK